MSDLERAWEFDAGVQERSAGHVRRFELGAAMRSPDLPRVYDANIVRIDRGLEGLDAAELERIVNRLQHGLGHRKLVMPGGEQAARLARELGDRGWSVNQTLVMRYEGPGERDPERAAAAEQVDARAARGARHGAVAGQSIEVQRQVAEYTERMAKAAGGRVFAAFSGGEVAAFCALLEGEGIGEIDEVTTLARFRRHGLGTAVVEAALQTSLAEGNDLTYLVANAGDWPRRWYERLGFAELGERWEVYRA